MPEATTSPSDSADGRETHEAVDEPPLESPSLNEISVQPDVDFAGALQWVKSGNKAARKGWNGKRMFIFLVPGSTFLVNRAPLLGIYPEGTEIKYHGHVDMKTAQGDIVPWLCSQTDMLAEDWNLL